MAATHDKQIAISVSHLSKTFPSQMALEDVELEVRAGEIHALLGQNGSGKSTLIKILAGFHQPDAGASGEIAGSELTLGSAAAARQAGIRFIHQDLALVADIDVVDNLALGDEYVGSYWLRDRRERAAVERYLGELELFDIDPRELVGNLAPAQQTMVAIARALRDGFDACRLLILDEPTTALGGHEVENLFALVRRIRDRGGSVLWVTHRLEEVFDLADRATILRDGRRVGTYEVAGLDHPKLVSLIIGRELDEVYPRPAAPREDVLFAVHGVSGRVVSDVSFDVRAGEVIGLAGLVGSGREDLPGLLFGATRWSGGSVEVEGETYTSLDPAKSIANGIALLPADRDRHSATPLFTVRENLTLPRIPSRGRARWLSARRERAEVARWLDVTEVVPRDPEAVLGSLSGGNQQKVVVARWLRCQPRVLIVDEPTQGVDVGAKAGIYDALGDLARSGTAVVIFSSDSEELAAICDRVLILRSGRIAAELTASALTPAAIDDSTLSLHQKEAA